MVGYAIMLSITQGSYIGYYSSFPSFGGGFDSRTLLQKVPFAYRQKGLFSMIFVLSGGADIIETKADLWYD